MWKKLLVLGLLTVVSGLGGGFAYLYYRGPESRPAQDIHVDMSPASIERGAYIYGLSDCDGCHSPHDPSRYDGPAIDNKKGAGRIANEPGLPGKIYLPNITPDKETGIGTWTDGEKLRAIREGIGKHGEALFPLMPYPNYRSMSDRDAEALVAYLNALPPVRNAIPRSQIEFPVSMFIKGVPKPIDGVVPEPDRSNPRKYGAYLVTLGGCEMCHTPMKDMSFDQTRLLSGGNKFTEGPVTVVSANITPDPETGIGKWSFQRFRNRFYQHRDHAGLPLDAMKPEKFTVMPWGTLSQLPEEDLAAIYAYLMVQRPIVNKIVTHPEGGEVKADTK